jgi:hypothetical protein
MYVSNAHGRSMPYTQTRREMGTKHEIIAQSGSEETGNLFQERTWYRGEEDKFKPHNENGEYDNYHSARNACRRMIGDIRADRDRGARIKLNTKVAPVKYLIEERPTKDAEGRDVVGMIWELIVRPVPGQVITPRRPREPKLDEHGNPIVREKKQREPNPPTLVPVLNPDGTPVLNEDGTPKVEAKQPRRARKREEPPAPVLGADGNFMPPPPPPPPPTPPPAPPVLESVPPVLEQAPEPELAPA